MSAFETLASCRSISIVTHFASELGKAPNEDKNCQRDSDKAQLGRHIQSLKVAEVLLHYQLVKTCA